MNKKKFRPERLDSHVVYVWDDSVGDLVYESDAGSTLERNEDEVVFTIRAPKAMNWKVLAETVAEECHELCDWAFIEQRKRHFNFEQLETISSSFDKGEIYEIDVRVDFDVDDTDEECEYNGEEPLFVLTHADHWWEMFESDDDYLIRYTLPKCERYPMMCRNDLDALEFLILDEMSQMTMFLRGWYDKVTGYADVNEALRDSENNEN